VLWSGAPDCPVCHRTVPGAPCQYKSEAATRGKTQARSAIIHQIVRCASEAMAIQRATVDSDSGTVQHSAQQKSEQRVRGAPDCPVHHQTVQCHKKTKELTVNCSRTLTVGWRGGAPDTEQWVSSGAPDCLVRPSTSASPTATLVVGGYKYPNHHNFKHPSFLNITLNTRALAFTPRHNSKDQILSDSQIHSKDLVACERDFVFFWALASWIAFLLFFLLFSSAL
jgi:hypothetical protein